MKERAPDLRRKKGQRKLWFAERLVEHYIDITVVGSENIGEMRNLNYREVPIIIIGNHSSYADAAVLNTVLRREAPEIEEKLVYEVGMALVKNKLTNVLLPYESIIVQSLRLKPKHDSPERWRKREQLTELAFGASRESLEEKKVLVLYPQGTRIEIEMSEVNYKNARYLNLVPNIHVIPVGISGTEIVLPPGKIKPIHGEVTLNFGKPISIAELESGLDEPVSEEDYAQKLINMPMIEVAKLTDPKYRGFYKDDS